MTGFKGWHVLSASFITAMLLAGATFYSFQHFVSPIEAEFGLDRKQVNMGMMLFLMSASFWAAFVGRTVGRISPRRYAFFGIAAFTLGFFLLSLSQSPKQMLFIIAGLIGFGFTACGPFMSNVLTTNWFYKNRGKALGIAAVSTSAGGFVVQPIFSHLIEAHGWRAALQIMAIIIFVIATLLIYRYFTSRPEDIDQFPDGANSPVIQQVVAAEPSKIIKNRDFWIIAIACGLLLGCDQALLISLKPFGEDLGFDNFQATMIPTVVAGSAILGKLGIGWLADRYDKRYVFALVCVSNMFFLLAAIFVTEFTTLIIVATCVGIAIGGIYPVWTSVTADTFGRDHFAAALGLMNLVTVIFAVIAMGYIGASYDANGDYYTAFKQLIPVAGLAAFVMMFVRTKQTQSKKVSS